MNTFPDWFVFAIVVVFLSCIMWAGYTWGHEVGLNKGHRSGFDLGRSVGRRDVNNK
jgi:hypothetical protein